MKVLLAAVCLLVLPGCVIPAAESDGSSCRDGEGIFVKAQHHPGFITPDYQFMFYTLERDGTFTYFRANETGPGSGKLKPVPGALHNITLTEVKAEMQRHGVYSTSKDFQVSVAYQTAATDARFTSFCQEVLDDFYDYDAKYENKMIADCDGFTFTINTHLGTHESYSYCGEGPDGVRKSFDSIRDDAWKKFGLEGL